MTDEKTWGEYIFDTVAHNNEHVEVLRQALADVPDDLVGINREGLENVIKLLDRNSTVIRKFDENISDGKLDERVGETLVVSPARIFELTFDSENPKWKPSYEYNFMFLRQVQNYVNRLLSKKGHVFMNEVLVELGMPETFDGAVKGWLVGSSNIGYIDFGLFTDGVMAIPEEGPIKIRLDVDGVIANKI